MSFVQVIEQNVMLGFSDLNKVLTIQQVIVIVMSIVKQY